MSEKPKDPLSSLPSRYPGKENEIPSDKETLKGIRIQNSLSPSIAAIRDIEPIQNIVSTENSKSLEDTMSKKDDSRTQPVSTDRSAFEASSVETKKTLDDSD